MGALLGAPVIGKISNDIDLLADLSSTKFISTKNPAKRGFLEALCRTRTGDPFLTIGAQAIAA